MSCVYSAINIAKQTFLVLRALYELERIERVYPNIEKVVQYLARKRPWIIPVFDEQVVRSEIYRLSRLGLFDSIVMQVSRKGQDLLRETLGSKDQLLESYQTWFTPPKELEPSEYERFAT